MPYIKPERRPELDIHIEALASAIKNITAKEEDEGAFAGLLNYSCTKLALKVIPGRRYKWIALITGVLENIKQEFYRRFAAPYEDEQIKKNGDVF